MPDHDALARRARLATTANPGAHRDYLVMLSASIGEAEDTPATSARVRVRYIPDRLVLVPEAFSDYLDHLGGCPWATLEEAALAILEDLGNELVPRWVEVAVSAPASAGLVHDVVLEDRQPGWDNSPALNRLRR